MTTIFSVGLAAHSNRFN